MNKRILIAAAWPYANGSLHLGHVAALIGSDILARYFRLNGDKVLFVSGSDCHGTQVQEKGISLESIQYYLDFFRFGCPPHAGYGLGLTRMLMVMLNLKSVREVTYLYRGVNRLTP